MLPRWFSWGNLGDDMVAVNLNPVRDFVRRFPLITAFGLSLLIHTGLYGGYRLGKQLGWWEYQATWLLNWKQKKLTPALLAKAAPMTQPKVIPLSFVEVNPATATPEPPKDSEYYGALNSIAANPEPVSKEMDKTKIDGKQEKVIRLADNPKPKPFPLQPVEPRNEAQPEVKKTDPTPPEPKEPAPGDLTQTTPAASTAFKEAMVREASPPPPEPKRPRPRTLAEVQAQTPLLAGQKFKQDGGLRRHGTVSLDVKATPFGAYDLAFIRAVEARWYSLLDSSSYVERSGKVVVEFRLNSDGRISEIKMNENDVGDILGLICQRAITDPAPFAKWPSDMRRAIGANYREVTFTFYYN
jgi:hypothetical protein